MHPLHRLRPQIRKEKTPIATYNRNHNTITTDSRIMVSGIGHASRILSIDIEGLTVEQIRRGETVVAEGCEGKLAPLDLIRLGMN